MSTIVRVVLTPHSQTYKIISFSTLSYHAMELPAFDSVRMLLLLCKIIVKCDVNAFT
jgi:hypothetical protein